MTLNEARTIITDSKHIINVHDMVTDTFDRVVLDYVGDPIEVFSMKLATCRAWEARTNEVYAITYNKAAGMIEIDAKLYA